MKCFNTRYPANLHIRNLRVLLIIILIGLINPSCERRQLVLEKVSDLPQYFLENIYFGKDRKSIDELKDFLLITGKVDTTPDFPPLRLAVIVVSSNKIFLTLQKTQTKNDEVIEKYEGDGYSLDLRYKEKRQNQSPLYYGSLIIKHRTSKGEYSIVGSSGYH